MGWGVWGGGQSKMNSADLGQDHGLVSAKHL